MKKIISVLLTASLISGCFGALNALAAPTYSDSVAPILAELKIMQGDPDGNLRPDDFVSRAECTKIAVASSKYRDTVATGSKTSPFKDVSADHWAAPYVTVAVKNGLCKGYLDATFQPSNTVTYEEALTMFLRVLGYSEEDFGSSWPDGQIGIAKNIGLCDGLSRSVGEELTRRDVMIIVYNLLNTPAKGAAADYISEFDRVIYDDVILIASNKEDSSVGAGKVLTSAGTYKITDDFDFNQIGKRGSIMLRNNDTIVSFLPSEQLTEEYTVTDTIGTDIMFGDCILDVDDGTPVYYKSKAYTYETVISEIESGDVCKVFKDNNNEVDYILFTTRPKSSSLITASTKACVVYSILGNSIVTYSNGTFDKAEFTTSTVFYEDDVQTSYAAVSQKLAMGDVLKIKYKENGTIDYVIYEEGNTIGPVTVSGSNWYASFGVNPDVTTIMRDGVKTSLSELKINDVAYYSEDLDMILTYSKKVTGVYESASPNKDTPQTVTVSGTTYDIEGVEAFTKLSSNGSFNYGDTVTLLLGKSGEVADVLSNAQLSDEVYGYLIETGTKETTVNGTAVTKPFVRLVLPSGESSEFITAKDYDSFRNQIVKLTFKDGTATISTVSGQSEVSGTFTWDSSTRTLGKTKLDSGLKIIEVSTTKSGAAGKAATVFPQRLSGLMIYASNILYVNKNNDGRITELILNDTTGDMHSYGVITSASKNSGGMSVSGSYEYLLNGNVKSLSTNGAAYSVSSGQPVKIETSENGSITGLSSLTKLSSAKVTDITGSNITYGGKVYKMSDNISIYTKDASYNYSMLTLDELKASYENYTLSLYYDKTETLGGRIRIIIATPN